MKTESKWPKATTMWVDNGTLYASIPFTWELPVVERQLGWYKRVVVGGPAVRIMPSYFDQHSQVEIGNDMPGLLQRINPMATKTTTGCVRKCGFCAVPAMEGKLKCLPDWPDLPILIDNNLLAAPKAHFDRVIDRLVKWGWADFNQGLDSRLLTEYHAKRISEIKKPLVRLSLDSMEYVDDWNRAFDILRGVGIAKHNIRSYALIGFDSDRTEAWDRCHYIQDKGIKVLPQWFHELDAMEHNIVTDKQRDLGWSDYDRRSIMQWFYQHKVAV